MRLLFVFLVLVVLKVCLLQRVYSLLPLYELRRRAHAQDHRAMAIYKVAVREAQLNVLLLVFGVSASAGLLVMAANYSWWALLITALGLVWVGFYMPKPKLDGWLWRYAAFTSHATFKIVDFLDPVLKPLSRLLPRPHQAHSRLYEKADLAELISRQSRQADNRISDDDLKSASLALGFGEKLVSAAMTPLKKAHLVSEDDVVGPTLLDELHKSGQSEFAVVKGSVKSRPPQIVGALYLSDIVEIDGANKGKVAQHMQAGTFFINEACNMYQALEAFLKTHVQLLVVVNKFEEITGVLSLRATLGEALGGTIPNDFDKFDNLHSTAGLSADDKEADSPEHSGESVVN